jgi:DNA-directed RNA polymerase II subunit RPB1
MNYDAGCIAESFQTNLFVIWSEDNTKKLIICCCMLGGSGNKDEESGTIKEDIFLQWLENTMLNSVSLHGIKDI